MNVNMELLDMAAAVLRSLAEEASTMEFVDDVRVETLTDAADAIDEALDILERDE